MLFWQDVVLTFPPYQYAVGEPSDGPIEKCWVVRPQLFFFCHLRPRGGRPPKRANNTYGAEALRTTSKFNSCSTSSSSPWSCQGEALWKLWASRSCTSPHPHPSSMWASQLMCWGARPWCPSLSWAFLLRPSHTSSFSTFTADFHMGWQMQLRAARRLEQEGKQRLRGDPMAEAVWANLVWGACRWLRLRRGASQG